MADCELKQRITEAMKAAMKAREKDRLTTIRLILADVKRIEVDERIDLDDNRMVEVLDKMVKQRKESIRQYTDAGRTELAAVEAAEIEVISEFLPAPLSEDEINTLINNAMAETGAENMRDMGKVMALIKPAAQGRADMSVVSQLIKAKLS